MRFGENNEIFEFVYRVKIRECHSINLGTQDEKNCELNLGMVIGIEALRLKIVCENVLNFK